MADGSRSNLVSPGPGRARLSAALRENLKRRKAQAKGRAQAGQAPEGPDPAAPPAPNSAGFPADKPDGNA
jgi:hypothetical protein